MLNKKFLLLFTAISLASCASNKQQTATATYHEPSKLVVEDANAKIEADTMFSVTPEEIKNSESGPHVVYFATNSSKLDDKAIAILSEKVLDEAKNANTKKVVIEAHCDERGSTSYNQWLSQKRAKAVKQYLVNHGVKSVKIKTIGYGASKPVALGHDEESWSQNRRAITISIKK